VVAAPSGLLTRLRGFGQAESHARRDVPATAACQSSPARGNLEAVNYRSTGMSPESTTERTREQAPLHPDHLARLREREIAVEERRAQIKRLGERGSEKARL